MQCKQAPLFASIHRESMIPLSQQDATSAAGRERPPIPSSKLKARPAPTPWKRMMLSPAVWAVISNNFAFHYAFYIIMNWLPTYFNRWAVGRGICVHECMHACMYVCVVCVCEHAQCDEPPI